MDKAFMLVRRGVNNYEIRASRTPASPSSDGGSFAIMKSNDSDEATQIEETLNALWSAIYKTRSLSNEFVPGQDPSITQVRFEFMSNAIDKAIHTSARSQKTLQRVRSKALIKTFNVMYKSIRECATLVVQAQSMSSPNDLQRAMHRLLIVTTESLKSLSRMFDGTATAKSKGRRAA